jgi:hypothetical protein
MGDLEFWISELELARTAVRESEELLDAAQVALSKSLSAAIAAADKRARASERRFACMEKVSSLKGEPTF